MDWILYGIVSVLILAIACFVLFHKRNAQKDQKIFDQYLENQRNVKFTKRNQGTKDLKKNQPSK
jgi:uncharacterized protein YxeA